MVIIRKDVETKEIEIQGFRKILKNPKHPDYKELRIYIKNGWIPVDPQDDEIEIKKANRRKQIAKENKARRPKYEEMEKNIQKLNNQDLLNEFKKRKEIKNNYSNVLKWYNEEKIKEQLKKKKQNEDKEETKTGENENDTTPIQNENEQNGVNADTQKNEKGAKAKSK